jgi:hypothetical protein
MPEVEAVTVQTVLLVSNHPLCLYKGMVVYLVEVLVVLDETPAQKFLK